MSSINLCIDFGGTNIKAGLVQHGRIIAQTSIPARSGEGLRARLADVESGVRALLSQQGMAVADCSALGIAMPGQVNPDTRQLLSIHKKYEDGIGFDFAGWTQSAFGLPLVMDNDAKAALMGEAAYGSARGERDVVLMIFGTGIGTAALMDGQLLRGKRHLAGCLGGHFIVHANGRPCTCGGQGCLEAYASHSSLPGFAAEHPRFLESALAEAGELNYKSVIDASLAGDTVARELLDSMLDSWSAGLVNLIHAYDPETVVLSGGLMKSADLILPQLEQRVSKLAWSTYRDLKFVVAEQPDASVLLGLSYLCEGVERTR